MLHFSGLQNLLIKRAICTTSKLRGYIVLVPEIGEDDSSSSAIINSDGLPKFDNLTVENCLANIGKQAGIVEKTVQNIATNIKNLQENNQEINVVETIFNPLENVTTELETIWGIAKTLYLGNSSKMPTKYYLNIHERAKRARSSKFHNFIIYDCIKKSTEGLSLASTTTTTKPTTQAPKFQLYEKRLIDKYLLEGKLNGLSLSDDNTKILLNVLNDLSKERTIYKNKVNTSIQQFSHTINNYSLVRNFPSELLISLSTDANSPTKGPWKLTLRNQSVINEFLKYCPDRKERWNIWQANIRKSSNLIDKSLDNSTHIEIIRSLRHRQAELLGYKNYVEMSMQTKMIKNYDNCKQLFDTLKLHGKYAQEHEINQLQEYAIENNFNYKLNLFDIPYWNRKYLKSNHNIDEEQLREFFPLTHVMNEVIKLCEQLFDIRFVERKESNVWHQTVKYYDLFDNDNDRPVAGLYLDCYSRDNSSNSSTGSGINNINGGGWMVGIRNRNEINSKVTIPLAALIFNFYKPLYGKSYLLTINDLKCLFKNFGVALQHLLTKSKYSDISGLSNVEWDASEICGNVLMNLLENSQIVKKLSLHYNTEEQLSDDKLQNFIRISNQSMSGYKLCNELYLSDLDLQLHMSKEFWLDIVKRLSEVYMPSQIQLDKKDYFHLCSWTDIFSGDWAAAYFSHLHSKMIADDISDSFDDEIYHHQTAEIANKNVTLSSPPNIMTKRFRDMFLYNDGSLTTAEIFRRFRGRDPSPIPLLKRSNLFQSNLHPKDN